MRQFHFLKKIYSQLLPFQCVLCKHLTNRKQDLCEACLNELPILTQPRHPIYALFSYEYPITRLLLTLKFNEALLYANILGELFAEKILSEWYLTKPLPDLIIPMPLHKNRLKERGFNQAVEIGRPIAKALKIPLGMDLCSRIKSTAPQATLYAGDRKQNMRNAFAVDHKTRIPLNCVILDDVITTGFTVSALAEELIKAGANQVDIWCIARAKSHGKSFGIVYNPPL